MSIECVFFDCDGTLVDSELICTQSYVNTFAQYGVALSLQEMFEKYKGVKLYDIVADVCAQHQLDVPVAELESAYRKEVARLFDAGLQPIAGAQQLLAQVSVPMCVVSNGTVKKMQHSLGLTDMLRYFDDRLYSGYDIERWKPDPELMFHAAEKMDVAVERCILVDDSEAGAKAGIAAGIPVFYYCADAHNQPLDHPLVTMFDDMAQLPALWKARGWSITA
ncbi:6-phosphogluconate phosphatase [Erwiniaceae bacterium BAC15a-03b]|uniref:6-phosphogluconate phosphatase n=1 Tax=Winslowiella arboricola TaxID=2978220 RepID=A0A9J6PNH2_9GAMM|nr:6-phosphogluconate phosphatase [Winslowiella arboricola]MCU5772356.1 6-phosphogluconate phosphatase [Winslowiella arboricola]MCU5776220.1 6-phosphogluconate phosphatase [Winslowiella arboricola]